MQFLAYTQMRKAHNGADRRYAGGPRPLSLPGTRAPQPPVQGRCDRARDKGLYLVPDYLPPGGEWTPDEASALNALMKETGGRYQICGLNAFNRYGYDEQVPARVYHTTTGSQGRERSA